MLENKVITSIDELMELYDGDQSKIDFLFSNFSCVKNNDVEKYLKNTAIEHNKQSITKTYLIIEVNDNNTSIKVVAFFTLLNKVVKIKSSKISKSQLRKLQKFSLLDTENIYIPTFFIAQLGKNDSEENFSGIDILDIIDDTFKKYKTIINGKTIFLHSINAEKVSKFYTDNGFKHLIMQGDLELLVKIIW